MMSGLLFANGDSMPQLGLGTWLSGPGETYDAVREAVRCGYRHIDCAQAYANQQEVGRALRDAFSYDMSREDLWVTSKLWNNDHHPERVRPAVEKALAELRLEYVDLYLMHWPIAQKSGIGDPADADDLIKPDELPLTETWEAMQQILDSGLARHIGVANFTAHKIDKLFACGGQKPEVNQVELHPYLQQTELVDFCHRNGIHVTAYSPLGSKGRPDHLKVPGEPILLEDPTLLQIADRHHASSAQIIIAWALQLGISTIPKSVNRNRIRENFEGTRISLSDEDMRVVAALEKNRRYNPAIAFTLPGTGYSYEWLWDEPDPNDINGAGDSHFKKS